MTPEQIQYVNDVRNNITEPIALTLAGIAASYNGPTKQGCFCKQSNIDRFVAAFYAWFDQTYNKQ